MKCLTANRYKFVGRTDNHYYLFKCIVKGFDDEYLILRSVRYIKEDGSSIYFDPVADQRSSSVEAKLLRA